MSTTSKTAKCFRQCRLSSIICEYLKITPQEFFVFFNNQPERLNAVMSDLKKLDAQTVSHIEGIIAKLANSH
jgi:hypothetical protein